MNIKLKKAILEFLCENEKDFQLTNRTIDHFRAYIYDRGGNYLIGGDEVANFIQRAEKLLKEPQS